MIHFKPNKTKNYFLSTWSGKITDREMIDEYIRFFSSTNWVPGMNELSDITKADMTSISPEGISQLCTHTAKMYSHNNVTQLKTAIYCSDALPFAIATVYKTFAEKSAENVRVFQDMDTARRWLLGTERSRSSIP